MNLIKELTHLQSVFTLQYNHQHGIALVPTMGNLHQGHEALLHQARKMADLVVLSIFVNPLQFNVTEDYLSYPKTMAHDLEIARRQQVDVVFLPQEREIYPPEKHEVCMDFPDITSRFCGKYRPGHFQGVLRIISILLHLVRPHYALFGEKDYQQLRLIQLMAEQLHFQTKVIGVPTVRAANGLAHSSRNVHLSAAERAQAGMMYQTLQQTQAALQQGSNAFQQLEQQGWKQLIRAGFKVDYFAIAEATYLQPAQPEDQNLVVLTACHLGKTRLIDNLLCHRHICKSSRAP